MHDGEHATVGTVAEVAGVMRLPGGGSAVTLNGVHRGDRGRCPDGPDGRLRVVVDEHPDTDPPRAAARVARQAVDVVRPSLAEDLAHACGIGVVVVHDVLGLLEAEAVVASPRGALRPRRREGVAHGRDGSPASPVYGRRSPVSRAAPSEPSRSSAAAPANHDETSRDTCRLATLEPSSL